MCGVATYTTSTAGSATRASYDAWAVQSSPPYAVANAWAEPGVREPTAASRAPGTSCRSVAKLRAIRPVARIPQPMVSPYVSVNAPLLAACGSPVPRAVIRVPA